jgi:hypothetical protein
VSDRDVRLGDEAAAEVQVICERFGITRGEAVRRGLSLLKLWAELDVDQHLAVTRQFPQTRFQRWLRMGPFYRTEKVTAHWADPFEEDQP